MEILGYVVDGPCDHTDNLGNAGPAESGWVQRMSAGSGIWHTEGNESTRPIRYLQLWIKPEFTNTPPEYTKMYFGPADKLNKFCPIASKEGPIVIKQNAKVSAGLFTQNYLYSLLNRRKYYLYVVQGSATINNVNTVEGDGIAIENEQGLTITDPRNAEILLFEV
jgi:redox-sensitive bicupin YhaK (pirin superfamily)